MQGHVFKPIGASRMYDWEHCAVCNLLSDHPLHIMTLPGCETTDEDRAKALASSQREEMETRLRSSRGDISARAGDLERNSPLFYGQGNNPTLF